MEQWKIEILAMRIKFEATRFGLELNLDDIKRFIKEKNGIQRYTVVSGQHNKAD